MHTQSKANRGFNLVQPVVIAVMCHHVDMAIDWEEAVTDEQSDQLTDDVETSTDADEPAVEAEESAPEAAPPADD